MSETCCSICFLPTPLLVTPCGHTACRQCFERILLTTKTRNSIAREDHSEDKELIEDMINTACPTRGRCPLCRKCTDMFELRHNNENRELCFTNEKTSDISISPLAGLSFSDRNGKIEIGFPKDSNEKPTFKLKLNLNDGCGDTKSIDFEKGYYFHKKTKTFFGKIDWTKAQFEETGEGSEIDFCATDEVDKWEVITQFSSEYDHIGHGAIIKYWKTNAKLNKYPLDGKWKIIWQKEDERDVDRVDLQSDHFRIIGNTWTLHGHSYRLNLDREQNKNIHFFWDSDTIQTVVSGVDLKNKPCGPDIGDTIEWKVNDSAYYRIFWTRETKNDSTPNQVELLGNDGTLIFRKNKNCETENPTYHSQSPWGNIFIQFLAVGVASYHFISSNGTGLDGAYISYEHHRCSVWPPLDNGSPIPARVPFVEVSFDADTRTFRGRIPWFDRYCTTWQGSKLWDYEIVFDSEFICIISGKVNSVIADDSEHNMYHFGETLNYVNVAVKQKIISGVSNGEDGTDEKIAKVIGELNNLKARLTEEGARERTLLLVSVAASGALHKDNDPIDYNLYN